VSIRVTIVAALALFLLVNASVAFATDMVNRCTARVQDPHFSSGAGGIIVKADWRCGRVPTTIALSDVARTTGLMLFLCPSKPPKDEVWVPTNCVGKGENHVDVPISVANAWRTRYAPPQGSPGAHGNGWWIACTVWYSRGPGGTSANQMSWSNALLLTG